MAATLVTLPADRVFSIDPVWVGIETEQVITPLATIDLLVSEPGASDGDTLRIQWGGNDLTFTVGADTDSALELPLRSEATTQLEYSKLIAERFLQCETITDYFTIEVTSPGSQDLIRLTQRTLQVVEIIITDDLDNIVVTAESVESVAEVENLRALVEIWSDTGNIGTDQKLISLHAPYNLATGRADIAISAAFSNLEAHLPDADTINYVAPPTELANGDATALYQKYYLRVADKYGSPPLAEALVRSENSYIALLGGLAGDATRALSIGLCHNYFRRDNKVFQKPASENQPDWVYFMPYLEDISVWVTILVKWSDGTNSVYLPFDDTPVDLLADHLYWFPSGFRQMKLQNLTPSGGTDEDAYIVGYDWRLAPMDEALNYTAIVRYTMYYDTPWEHYLIFTNGAGGMETVWLRGKASGAYTPDSEEFTRPRRPGHNVAIGDFKSFTAEGRMSWEMNTGWYDDPYYLQHLKQLSLSDAWLVDVPAKRFLKVTVAAKDLVDIETDDVTLYALQFDIRAGWIDHAHNG